jgi:hypothetical protein
MLKKDITFTDFDGEVKTQTHYFNLTKAECVELQTSVDTEGGFADSMFAAVEEASRSQMIAIFKDLIARAYGVRTPNGGFVKSEEQTKAFLTTEAYSALFMEIITDEKKSIEFFRGIMPADLIGEVDKLETQPKRSRLDAQLDSPDVRAAVERKRPGSLSRDEVLQKMKAKSKGWPKELTYEEVVSMTQEDLTEALDAGCTIPA